MIIETNGIKIERLQEYDIELVRQWRNSSFVQQHMNYREHITPEMQLKWFRSVDNFNNFYFILRQKNTKVGLGNIKNIDWDDSSGEAGVFIAERNPLFSFLPVVWVLSLSELVFKIFKLKRIYSQVRPDNRRAMKFNKLFGYKLMEGEEDKESQLHYLNDELFLKATRKIFLLMKPLGFKTGNIVITLEAHDYETEFGKQMEQLIIDSGMRFKLEKDDELTIFRETKD